MVWTNVRQGLQMLANQVQQLVDAVKGTPGRGQRFSLTNYVSDTLYALTVQNTGSGGKAFRVLNSSGTELLAVNNDGLDIASLSDEVALPLGSATTPSLHFTGDTNTGMYSSGADTLDFATGGTNKVSISSTALAVDTSVLYVDFSNNRVGINDATPSYELDVAGQIRSTTGVLVDAGGLTVTAGGITMGGTLTLSDGVISVPVDASSGASDPEYTFTGDTNTGMYSSGADTLNFSTGGTERLRINASGVVEALSGVGVTGGLYLTNGQFAATFENDATTPEFSFLTDLNTGMYSSAADTLNFSTGGTSRLSIDSAGLVTIGSGLTATTGNVQATAGGYLAQVENNAASPEYSFVGDTNTGMYSSAADTLNFSTGGTSRLAISSAGLVTMANGATLSAGDFTVSTGGIFVPVDSTSGQNDPEYSFVGDTNTGMYSSAADTLDFATGGTNRMSISSTGGVTLSGVLTATNAALTTPTLTTPNISTLTTAGDLLYGTGSGAITRRALGTKGYVLLADTSAPQWDRFSRRNYIINGDMQVSQRNAVNSSVVVTDNTYITADRWRMLYDSASNAPSTYNNTSFFTSTAGASFNTLTFQAANSATGRHGMFQVIESKDAAMLRGTSVSLSFLAFAQSSFGDIRAAILYWTGTADGTTADPVTTWASLASGTPGNASGLSGSWLFANTPSNLSVGSGGATYKIENISIPQAANNVAVLVWCDDTSTTFGEFWGITNVQLERGAIATTFENRPAAQELALCQRYYYRYASEPIGIAYSNTILATDSTQLLPVPMRVVPSISGATFSVNAGSAGTVAASALTTRSLRFYNSDSNWTITALVSLTAEVSAEL